MIDLRIRAEVINGQVITEKGLDWGNGSYTNGELSAVLMELEKIKCELIQRSNAIKPLTRTFGTVPKNPP